MTVSGLPLDLLLEDWRDAAGRAEAYLEGLGAPAALRRDLARRAVAAAAERRAKGGAAEPVALALDALREILRASHPALAKAGHDEGLLGFRFACLARGGLAAADAPARVPPCSAPPLERGPMVPERYGGRRLGERRPRGERRMARPPRPPVPRWRRVGRRRRLLLLLLILVPSVLAGRFMLEVLPHRGGVGLEPVIAVLFGALFGWISTGFWTAALGFAVLLRRGGRFAIGRDPVPAEKLDPDARVAVVMPICDEPVERVFAGLRATHASLARTGELARFDFFVLSDSADPSAWVQEEWAWAEWLRRAPGGAGIYYRRRRVRRKRKSGNVAEFCRRWGRRYRYLVVLDADSVMSGATLVRMVRVMERRPAVGIVQTVPRVVRARTLFGRLQQFGNRLYGPLFAAGMHYWQLGDCPYWGHNAIVRMEPFMAHGALPRLSGEPPFGGDILSHDFVEAALLGRHGWSTWLLLDEAGSYEESPDTLLDEMQRDRRWCQGNLQHLRLFLTEGVRAAHRALFLNGIFAYVSALLWLFFLVASTAEATFSALRPTDYFPSGRSLFPEWPVWRPDWVLAMLAATAAFLFLPKLLGLLFVLVRREARRFGGVGALLRSAGLEILASALLAPVRMLFYCRFVLQTLGGRVVRWRQGEAEGGETTWRSGLRHHGLATGVALAWAVALYVLDREHFAWALPVAGSLVLSIPISVVASRRALGEAARRRGWLRVPEEVAPPAELRELEAELAPGRGDGARLPADGFVAAVVHPLANALHATLLRGPRSLAPPLRAAREALVARALADGPAALDAGARRTLLSDRGALLALHDAVWRLDRERAVRWGVGGA